MSDHHLVSSHNDGLDAPLQIAPRRLYDKGANRLQVARLLGFDWLLLFLQPQVKSSSVILAANCLVLLLSVPNLLAFARRRDNGRRKRMDQTDPGTSSSS